MKISGFSFVRNAEIFDYPILESITSLLPICDEVIIAVGESEDNTLKLIQSIQSPKLKIIETVWDDTLRQGGKILADQTNLALQYCSGDWCIYLQADEILHEEDYQSILDEITTADCNSIDSLLFSYLHFYGSYDFIGAGRQWYRQEIRAFRNSGKVISWGDAQGFRKIEQTNPIKLTARRIPARIFHYGWVKHPRIQQRKQMTFHKLWHSDEWMKDNIPNVDEFEYQCYQLEKFVESHPKVMKERIKRAKEWTQLFDNTRLKPKPFNMKITDFIERISGWRIGEYKNFIEV
ncbi:MAG: glycosyltransferase [Bacteroidetes bacterium]|nr:glycosyltransferase [Bacteroidota bacterium]